MLLDTQTYTPCEETELPVFLSEVWPAPAEVMSVEMYNRSIQARSISDSGVGVIIIPSLIDSAKNLSQHTHQYYGEKSTLYLDDDELPQKDIDDFYVGTGLMSGLVIDEDGNRLQYDAGPYYMTWLPPVSLGTHRAIFSLTNREGKIFEFGWCYTIAKN